MGATADKVKGATFHELAIGKAKQDIGQAVGSDRLQGEGAVQEIKGKGQKSSATPSRPPRTPSTTPPPPRTRISDRRGRRLNKIAKTGPVGPVFFFLSSPRLRGSRRLRSEGVYYQRVRNW